MWKRNHKQNTKFRIQQKIAATTLACESLFTRSTKTFNEYFAGEIGKNTFWGGGHHKKKEYVGYHAYQIEHIFNTNMYIFTTQHMVMRRINI